MKQPASRAKPVDRMILHVLNHRRSTRRLGRGAAVMVLAMASAGNVIAGSSDLRYGWTNVVSAPDGISGSAATDIDSSGNILVFGVFDEAADMDPGEGEDIHVCEDRCMFLSKYGPDGTYRWTVSWSLDDSVNAFDMVVDTQDNAILTGGFWGRQDLDPGPGEDWHDAGEVPDIYVIKIGPEGALRWAESMGGEDFAHGLGVAADAQDGIYVTGSFRGTVDFDPSEQEDVHTSGGGSDVFLTKFDEAGDYEWTYRIGGPNGESAIGLALDSEGNIFLSGGARVGTDFDPTDGVDIQQPIDGNLDGHSDVFLTRINADLSYAWTRVFGGTESDGARDLAISNHDRLIITGVFRGLDADFDPDDAEDIHKSRGESDNFVTTFTDDGEYLWTRTFGGDWRDESHTVAVDSHGDIYVGGNIRENRDPRIPVDMDPTEGEDYRLPKRTDCFVTKLGADGSYLWSNVWGTESFDEVDSIVLDQCENVIYAGIFWRAGPVDFDPTEGEDLREAIGLFEAFTSKLLPCGNGDANGDCRVTPTDFESTFPCLAGPGVEVSTSCCAFDFDLDGDVDLSDFSVFQELFDTN